MKIIDKNTDFYDYIQYIHPDDTFTFDRSDSFELTKDILCQHIYLWRRAYLHKQAEDFACKFLLLQVGSTFWLFLMKISATDDMGKVKDYEIELLRSWKNYSKPRKLILLSVVEFGYAIANQINSDKFSQYYDDFSRDKIIDKTDVLVQAIDSDDYKVLRTIGKNTSYCGNTPVERHIPLLKSCGIGPCINPQEIYDAFDEYFSMEKMASERIDAEGTTNNDKIVNHGFDTKTSFRGKVK